MNITHHSPLAIAYAQSLLQLAWEQKTAESVMQELAALKQVLKENPHFGLFLADPAISENDRAKALDHIFRSQLSPLTYNFLGVMNLKGRLGTLPQVIDTYKDLLDQQLGNTEVDITVAHKLSAEALENVRQRIGAAIGKNAVIHEFVDDAIIGGMVVRIGDKLIDASVKYQLQAIRQTMLAARKVVSSWSPVASD